MCQQGSSETSTLIGRDQAKYGNFNSLAIMVLEFIITGDMPQMVQHKSPQCRIMDIGTPLILLPREFVSPMPGATDPSVKALVHLPLRLFKLPHLKIRILTDLGSEIRRS
jgi:hypothetical protein